MPHLALALLGPFEATLDGQPVEGLSSDRLRALLSFLAVDSRREHPREQVAALLWPERPDPEALGALRYALSNLHAALGDRHAPSPFLIGTRTGVQFNPAGDHWLDLAEFEALGGRPDVPALERAAALYRGPFLHGISLGDSPAFEDWLLLKDEESRRRALEVLGRLTALQMARAEYAEAARWARRQLELEPYREHAHRQLMSALALGGERAAALAHYETCRRVLAQELGCAPEDETRALYAQIRDGALPQPQASSLTQSVSTVPVPLSADARPPSRFVAREREMAHLHTLLNRALLGGGGVALIAGEAGSGKTALLDEFARQAGRAHGDLIALRGSCNAHGGRGDPYLPFREVLQTLAGDVEGKRAGGTVSPEQARRVWAALPAMGAALAEHGPDMIDSIVPGDALLRRAEAFRAPAGPLGAAHALGTGAGQGWQAKLREIVHRGREGATPAPPADLFAQVTQVLHTVAMRTPLLLAIDDLQWADGGTAALLFHLGRRLAGSRILLACAYRPEALQASTDLSDLRGSPDLRGPTEGSLGGLGGLGSVLRELTREWGDVLVDLDEADGRAFVEAYVDIEPNRLGAAFRQALYDHTGGNPLFTVELLRSFEREGALRQDDAGRWIEAADLDWECLPPQVEAVIAGHMASLPGEDRALLQAASVQGELFAAEVAARVLGRAEEAVAWHLSGPLRTRHRLVEAVSLDRLPETGQRLSHYRFRHSLVQRGAYRSLDAVERARLHEATGRALEAIHGLPAGHPTGALAAMDRPEAPPLSAAQALAPQLARHYEAAGMPLEAACYRLEAGRWAVRLVAYEEAIAHLERGLVLLECAPASGERLRLELALCLAIVNPAMLRGGWRAPGYAQVLERLSDLTQHPDLQGQPQCLSALSMLALLSTWGADPERGQRIGEQLLGLAEGGDPQASMLAHWVLGHSYSMQGQLVAAREHLQQALALHDPGAGRPLSPLLGADPSVVGLAQLGWTLWLLGYPDQARTSLRQALAQAGDRPSSAAIAHLMAGIMYLAYGRDPTAAMSHVQALRPLAEAGRDYGPWAELLAAQASYTSEVCQTSEVSSAPERCLAQAAQAASALQATGPGTGYASQSLIQAQLCAWAGQAEKGLAAMDRALAWMEWTGMRSQEAEVWRMRGELLLVAVRDRPPRSGRPRRSDEAEACFRRALDIAREQEARWLELRAAVSLARLWGASGRRDEARELLTGIYGWFTEGFDLADLVEAKALLEELA